MFDMLGMMGKIKEAQEKMKSAQENSVKLTASAEVGGGMVKATVNGKRQIISLEIDSEIMNDREMVQDLTIAAVNKALEQIDTVIKEEMKKSMEGVLPNIPGLDLSALMR
jgi:nucleoid-associated protein EbfC